MAKKNNKRKNQRAGEKAREVESKKIMHEKAPRIKIDAQACEKYEKVLGFDLNDKKLDIKIVTDEIKIRTMLNSTYQRNKALVEMNGSLENMDQQEQVVYKSIMIEETYQLLDDESKEKMNGLGMVASYAIAMHIFDVVQGFLFTR